MRPTDLQRHAPQAFVGEQVEHVDVDDVVLGDFLLAGFQADDGAGDLVGGVDLDLLAADLAQELGQRADCRSGRWRSCSSRLSSGSLEP